MNSAKGNVKYNDFNDPETRSTKAEICNNKSSARSLEEWYEVDDNVQFVKGELKAKISNFSKTVSGKPNIS